MHRGCSFPHNLCQKAHMLPHVCSQACYKVVYLQNKTKE